MINSQMYKPRHTPPMIFVHVSVNLTNKNTNNIYAITSLLSTTQDSRQMSVSGANKSANNIISTITSSPLSTQVNFTNMGAFVNDNRRALMMILPSSTPRFLQKLEWV